ncbi:MAG TPA: ribosome biogenesis/translation initiation ATPase RLI [Candidatus Acidoferrum sp.]|nr:ribosome biogenesis/translation initiation ATPase RLI [Candidatus Acidoferrum sp.]
MLRVATLDKEHCKPDDCGIPCYRFCPEVLNRSYAIKFLPGQKKPIIDEDLCTGCGICIKKCPFEAISIVKLPQELEGECIHSYGVNEFKLFRLPVPRTGTVTGIIGRNGTGKSTALRILSGELTPNFGSTDGEGGWEQVLARYRGTLLHEYFQQIGDKKLKVVHKPQHIDKMGPLLNVTVSQLLTRINERDKLDSIVEEMELEELLDRNIKVLSGGELQRVAIAAAISRNADVYVFDEPSSHLDVYQRIRAARSIRKLVNDNKSILVAEHDLAMLDYLSDEVYLVYGQPSVYGIVSHAHPTRGGINDYLEGFLADENMRFRDEPIRFHVRPPRKSNFTPDSKLEWPEITKDVEKFKLHVKGGDVTAGEIIGIVGPNGIGKTTFIKELVEYYGKSSQNLLEVSYKPQYISTNFDGTVDQLLNAIAKDRSTIFTEEVLKNLTINKLLDREIKSLSGGELQRVAIAACLGKSAQIYLLDEPSAFLDIEERLTMARALRHIIDSRQAFAFVVEHDIVAQDFLADRIMVFGGIPGRDGVGSKPQAMRDAMNNFLSDMEITFRRDPETKRPRINKPGSKLDKEQKDSGEYYYVTAND